MSFWSRGASCSSRACSWCHLSAQRFQKNHGSCSQTAVTQELCVKADLKTFIWLPVNKGKTELLLGESDVDFPV